MKRNEQNIDDFFKSELADYVEAPPPAAWEALEKKLDRKAPRLGHRRYFPLYIFSAMIANRKMSSRFAARWVINLGIVALVATIGILTVKEATHTTPAQKPVVAANASSAVPATKENQTPGMQPVAPIESSVPSTDNNNPSKETFSSNNTASQEKTNNRSKNRIVKPGRKAARNLLAAKQQRVQTQLKSNYSGTGKIQNGANGAADETTSTSEPIAPAATTSKVADTNQSDFLAKSKLMAAAAKKHRDSVAQVLAAKMKPKAPVKFDRLEAGIKAGFERGFDNDASKKVVVSPYLQYNISRKLAIMIQPTIKYASFNVGNIGVTKSYYKVNNDSTGPVQAGPSTPGIPGGGGGEEIKSTPFAYAQSHDSIVKFYTYGGKYMEYEMPVLLKFRLTKELSVYGGVNMTYSKQTGITENTNIQKIWNRDTIGVWSDVNVTPIAPFTNSVIKFTGNPISNYTGPLYPSLSGGLLRFGYMFGFSLDLDKRWMLDGLVQQGMTKQNMIGGFDVNEPLSAPYFRFTLGYKLLK